MAECLQVGVVRGVPFAGFPAVCQGRTFRAAGVPCSAPAPGLVVEKLGLNVVMNTLAAAGANSDGLTWRVLNEVRQGGGLVFADRLTGGQASADLGDRVSGPGVLVGYMRAVLDDAYNRALGPGVGFEPPVAGADAELAAQRRRVKPSPKRRPDPVVPPFGAVRSTAACLNPFLDVFESLLPKARRPLSIFEEEFDETPFLSVPPVLPEVQSLVMEEPPSGADLFTGPFTLEVTPPSLP